MKNTAHKNYKLTGKTTQTHKQKNEPTPPPKTKHAEKITNTNSISKASKQA